MKAPAKAPCKECPMRRVSLPGYLGDDEPDNFIAMIHSDLAMPCHSTVNYEDPDWKAKLPAARQCAGQAIYLSNVWKRPRPGPGSASTLPADGATVFASPSEFLDHHKRGPMAKKTTKKAAKKVAKKSASKKSAEKEFSPEEIKAQMDRLMKDVAEKFEQSETKAQKVADKLLDKIDTAGEPEKMSKREWKDLLDILIFDLGVRLECVEGELEEEEADE